MGVFVLTDVMRVLVILAPSCTRFHPFGEIWTCSVFVLFVIASLTALHVVSVTFVGPQFGFVSSHLVMILRSSTDHGSNS